MKKTLSTVVLAFLMFSAAAHAQSPSGETSSDEPTFVEPTPQLRWSLGLGVISSPRPYIGVDNKITPIPLIELTYKKWYVQGIQAGYHFIDNRKFTLRRPDRFCFRRPRSRGLTGTGRHEQKGLLGRRRVRLRLETRQVPSEHLHLHRHPRCIEWSAGGDGLFAMWMFNRGQSGIVPSVGVVWQSSNMVDYYVGVTPEEARPGRPVFIGHSAINFRTSLLGFFYFSPRIRLTGLLRVQRLDNEISESPIVDESRGVFRTCWCDLPLRRTAAQAAVLTLATHKAVISSAAPVGAESRNLNTARDTAWVHVRGAFSCWRFLRSLVTRSSK